MSGPGFDRVVAVLELVTGLGVAGYMIVLGVSAGSGGVAFFVLAAVFLIILAAMSRGSWRRVRARVATTVPTVGDDDVAPPVLSDAGRAELAVVVTRLADAGLFAPHVPDPGELAEAVADQGEPVEDATVLAALLEIDYWHPGRDPADHLDALAFHDAQVEQLADSVRAHVDDLARLVGDALDVRADEIDVVDERTRVRLRLGDDERVLDWIGHPKHLSPEIHIAVARAVPGPRRLAWLWTDQGVWLAAPRGGALPGEQWAWVDAG